ncbi:MAG: YfhO family protein [Bryobacteraceae bacterium]
MRAERLRVALLALITTYAFFYEYLPPFKTVYLYSDIAGYHYPLQRYAFQALKDGRIPQWDSSIYCGISFVGNVQTAFLYPPTWLMYAFTWRLPRIPFRAMEAFTFLHVWLAFLLCYMWLRGKTGSLASAFGAAVFAYTGYMVSQFWHIGVVCSMTWMPLGLWGIDEAVSRRDWRPLWKVAAASALSFLAGYPAVWIVYCVMVVAYALASRVHWRAAVGVCVALAASVLLFMVQLLPAMEARSRMLLEPKYGPGAYGWRLLLCYLLPNWFDFNPGHSTAFESGGMYLYLGLPALFAFAWAVRRHSLRPHLQALIGLAVALVLANPSNLLVRTVERIPTLDDTMQPFNFYAGAAAMAALITAVALDDFLRSASRRALPRWLAPAVATALLAWSVRQLWIWAHGGAFAIRGRAAVETAVALALFSLGLYVVREATGRRRSQFAAILLLAAGVDYKVFGASRQFNASPGDVDDQHPKYGIGGVDDTAYRAMWANRHYRVVSDGSAGPPPTDYRMWGLATPEGFDPFLPVQYKQLIQHWVPFSTNRLFDTDLKNEDMLQELGVRYVLVHDGESHEAFLAASPNFRLVGRKEIWCRVYEYLHARPPYRWEEETNGTVQPVAWNPEQRDFLVRADRGGRFVLVEQFYPGWTAVVDGHPAGIERWGGAFQAIPVPAGEHRITFEFRPMSLRIGAAISLLAGVGLLLLMLADGRSRRHLARRAG